MRLTGTRAIAAILLGLLTASPALAQDSLIARMLRSRNRWLHYSVINGRISLQWSQLIQFSTNSTSTRNDGKVTESLQVANQNGQLNLSYQRTAKDELLKIATSGDGDVLSISRAPREKSTIVPLEFRQAPGEKIAFSIGDGDRKQTFSAADLWELLIVRRKECEQHLLPLLEMLRPDWKLADTAASVEKTMVQGAGKEVLARRSRWAKLVEQLGDDRFGKREAADRALRADGPAVVGFLRQLDFSRLDAEQRFRIRRIIESFSDEDKEDSVEDIAAMLADNPAVWLALLGRPEPDTRKTAAKQLTLLLGGPIDVDPAADPDTQKQKRLRLQERIETKNK